MSIVLYVGFNHIHNDYFTHLLDREGIRYNTEKDFLGYRIEAYIDENNLSTIIKYIIEFMIEFHLKDFVLSKIYDEYVCLDVNDACNAMNLLIERASSSDIYEKIRDILSGKNVIHIENYIVFNIRYIMLTIYEITDDICKKMTYEKERKAFISMLRTYAALSCAGVKKADVEFTSEFNCSVSVDNHMPVQIENDKLLSFLTSKAPLIVRVKGKEFSPALSGIITEIFNNDD